jgi:hypothetical protein
MEYNYYDVHFFYSRKDGCSRGVKVPVDIEVHEDDTIIDYGVLIGIYDKEDAQYVDSVTFMDKKEFEKVFEI